MKNQITKGTWLMDVINKNILHSNNGEKEYWQRDSICTIHDYINGRGKANAEAICNAVNNTYGKGINPEAVPELLAALKSVLETLVLVGEGFKFPAISEAKSAIEKAIIK